MFENPRSERKKAIHVIIAISWWTGKYGWPLSWERYHLFHTITLFEICYALRCHYKGTGGHRLCPSWNCMIGVIINDTQAITFEEAAEVASKRNGSDLDCFTAPNSERKIVRFCVLSLCRKAAAHFLHTSCTFPEYQVFLRKMRTACFPLHKRKKS